MKKIYLFLLFLIFLPVREINAQSGICGTNVMFTINGNKASFRRTNAGANAVWASDCTAIFKNMQIITEVEIIDTISLPKNSSRLFADCKYVQRMDLAKFDTSKVTNMSRMFYNTQRQDGDYETKLTFLDVSGWNTANVTNMMYMFLGCSSLEGLDVSGWDTANVTNMMYMFCDCSSLEGLNVSGWNTSNVLDMKHMFHHCRSLKSLNVTNWDVSNVIYMQCLFNGCSSLTSLDISQWDVSRVLNMECLFYNCYSLTKLDVSDWNTSNVTNMWSLFCYCSGLKSLDISRWNTSNVIYMQYMFYGCNSLEGLDVRNWNTSNVTNMRSMFYNCSSLEGLDVSGWDTANVTNMMFMFYNCSSLESLDVSGWNTANVTNMGGMFYNCISLDSLDVSGWNTANVTNMSVMFYECHSLSSIDVSNWDTSNVNHMGSMFQDCWNLTNLDAGRWNTSRVEVMGHMFTNCNSLEGLDVRNWNTSNVMDMQYMFYNCNSLENLDVSDWNTSNVTNMWSLFCYCSGLKSLDISRWNTSKVNYMQYMFYDCNSLEDLDVSGWDTSNVTNMSGMFYNCRFLTSLDVSGWDTSNVVNMGRMFESCFAIASLDVSRWDTSNVTNMNAVFFNCHALESLDVSGWDTSNVTNMSGMFCQCHSLSSVDVSNWDTSNVNHMGSMFQGCWNLTNLDAGRWNTSRVKVIGHMFTNCNSLTNLDISGWDTTNVTNAERMFSGSYNLFTLTIGEKTLRKNIFTSLPSYSETWYYAARGKAAANPLPLKTARSGDALFGSYDYKKMAGTWTINKNLASVVKIYDPYGEDITGKTLSISNFTYELRANAAPEGVSQRFIWKSSDSKTALVNGYGVVTFKKAGSVKITAMASDGSNKSASVTLRYQPQGLDLVITDTNIRGKNKEIQVTVPWNASLIKAECRLYDDSTGREVKPKLTERMDATGKNRVISWVGAPLENGKVYRFKVRVFNGIWSDTVEKYAMPISNVYGATVVAGNKTMVINTQHREPATGTRYMVFDAATQKELSYKLGTKTNTTWKYDQLQNGKLYYVVAVPYRDYKGQRLWGPNQNRIYFVPMGVPANGKVSFSGPNAAVSITADSSADGIRVLYRTVGGTLKNGCEAKGSKCTIKGLNSSTAYEFYAMKYKIAEGKTYYSMGTLIPWKTVSSGLTTPQMNPVVAMNNSGYTTFSIKKSTNAEGISVLYKIGNGTFQQACEKAGNSCSTTLDITKNYTFYIMQYRTLNGKKVYSPGIVARDYSSGKSAEYERLYTGFVNADESVNMEEIFEALPNYFSEDDLLIQEAFAVMDEELVTKDAETYYEDEDFDYSRYDDDMEPVKEAPSAVNNNPSASEEEEMYFYYLGENDTAGKVPSFEN